MKAARGHILAPQAGKTQTFQLSQAQNVQERGGGKKLWSEEEAEGDGSALGSALCSLGSFTEPF